MHYSMWHARLGEYEKDNEDEVIENLKDLDPKLIRWLDVDIHTDDKVRSLLNVSDGLMEDLAPSGVHRQTGSGIDKARLKQPSYLKEQTGVSPNGLMVSQPPPTEAMKYETEHKEDGFNGVVAWFTDWFHEKYCQENGIDYTRCKINAEGTLGWIVWKENEEFAYHPDGRITVDLPDDNRSLVWLVKITCPLSKKDHDTLVYAPIFGEHSVAGVEGLRPMPSKYFADVNFGMKIMGIPFTLFGVWTPMHPPGTKDPVQVQIVEHDVEFTETMIADAKDYFWKIYIPRLRELQEHVKLAQNMLTADMQRDHSEISGFVPPPNMITLVDKYI